MNNVIEGSELARNKKIPQEYFIETANKALGNVYKQFGAVASEPLPKALISYTQNMGFADATDESKQMRSHIERTILKPMNDRASQIRSNWYKELRGDVDVIDKADPVAKALSKANLDVGTLTNFANITGGQALGYVSLDTRLARGTVRPNSFTLYQCLHKSLAWQVVDFWATATATGGAPPGSAFANFSSVTSGALNTSAGTYVMNNITLKMALDGRAITTALAAQNNYVNVSEQENVNAALVVLQSVNWANYWGKPELFSNQFQGISDALDNAGVAGTNKFDFWNYYNANSAKYPNWQYEVFLYALIYEAASQITSFGTFGRITHAFMSPNAMGGFQALTVTQLNNILNTLTEVQGTSKITVDGELVGMRTRFGSIQFPMDLFIDSRDIMVAAFAPTQATSVGPTPPTSITAAVTSGVVAGSEFSGSYTPSTGSNGVYWYAVVSCDASMNESTPAYITSQLTGLTAGYGVTVTINPPGAADAAAFRVFRSGLGYNKTMSPGSVPDPNQFRYIGAVAANGASTVTFTDLNQHIPGSTSIFLLDMDPVDLAIDYRLLLPLVRVELFAANLFMPWAVASIGSIRLRIPKFHGMITNFVPTQALWNPLTSLNGGPGY